MQPVEKIRFSKNKIVFLALGAALVLIGQAMKENEGIDKLTFEVIDEKPTKNLKVPPKDEATITTSKSGTDTELRQKAFTAK